MIISGLQIHTENEVLTNASVVIENQKIKAIENKIINSSNSLSFPASWHLIPGMIDMHIHGAAGKDVLDSAKDSKALPTICSALPKEGVTAFLATTLTTSQDIIENVLQKTANFIKSENQNGAEVLGIYLEGPFLSPKKHAAQPLNYILLPEIKLFQKWQSLAKDLIKVVTIAPEVKGAMDFITYLKSKQIIASLGHSIANYEEANNAIKKGISHATHLFNAMPQIHHRNPGAVLALLLDDNVSVEIIVDGEHLHTAIIKLIFQLKGADKIILISDAIRAKGMPDGKYDLSGQEVTVKNNQALLSGNILAGSVLKMDQAMRNMMQFTGCSLQNVIKMTSENPAKKLNIFDIKGSIAENKDADLVILNEKYEVMMTICRGEIVFQKSN